MPLDHETLRQVAQQTEVLRLPRQALATFGTTAISYYLVTEPVYAELLGETRETVVRRGRVAAERPQIVTPFYLLNLFRGFEHGEEFASFLAEAYGADSPGLMYSYRNELEETSIVSDPLAVVAGRLPPRAMGLVMEWATQHQRELRQVWNQARNQEPLDRIDPLP